MADDAPQLYLVTPPQFDPDPFSQTLAGLLDAQPVACVRLALATRDEETLMRAADALRGVTEPHDVALVIADHWKIAERAGLDGVHLGDGSRNVRKARADLGADAIVGAWCATSRHDGMTAGEAGADYIAFGPVGGPTLGEDARAEDELFQWWSEIVELPVIAEGGLDEAALSRLATITDFVALGEELWSAPDPLRRLAELTAALHG
ncbi:thiamine phosphate synthase [Palleronia sediminis]|uniref:Thiamine phosphate synthase n=1 Tax=Palleronia sediminis TaxID=2547833 RepID=A0A4R6APG6_9RHOB|nr:thiamine phosphate synthase [Palleronia sediminis]TDL83533.1 thiamine phosphate synthase [Palleronia sediminis]